MAPKEGKELHLYKFRGANNLNALLKSNINDNNNNYYFDNVYILYC